MGGVFGLAVAVAVFSAEGGVGSPEAFGNAALEQEGPDLIDDAGALADQTLTHSVQRLQIELIDRLRRDELHGRALYCFSDRLRITEVVLLSLRIGRTYFAGINRAS
jgi:hypothetical protein